MGLKIEKSRSRTSEETLRILRSKGRAHGKVNIISYRDKDTRQIIMYIPSFDITGYGNTPEKAQEMVKFSFNEYLDMLLHLQSGHMEKVLKKLGWQKKVDTIEFSKAYIDSEGKLKNLNAVADEIEESVLSY